MDRIDMDFEHDTVITPEFCLAGTDYVYVLPNGQWEQPYDASTCFESAPHEPAVLPAQNSLLEAYETNQISLSSASILGPGSIWRPIGQEALEFDLFEDFSSITPTSGNFTEQAEAEDAKRFSCEKCSKTFTRRGDLNRHNIRHDPDSGGFICGHCLEGLQPSFETKRKDKLIRHMRDKHHYSRAANQPTLWKCPLKGCHSKHTVYFFEKDKRDAHVISNHESLVIERRTESIPDQDATLILSDSYLSKVETFAKNSNAASQISRYGEKRPLGLGMEVVSKRARSPSMQKGESNPSSIMLEEYLERFLELCQAKAREIEVELSIFNVQPADFLALSNFRILSNVENSLKPLSLPGAPAILFDVSQNSIKLRGSAEITQTLKNCIENILESKELWKPSRSVNSTSVSQQGARTSAGSRGRESLVFPLRAEEDSGLLMAWHEVVLPSLPTLLAKNVGDTYSASLVREGISECTWQAVVRIHCLKIPSKNIQEIVRSKIIQQCSMNATNYNLRVRFMKGPVVLLGAFSIGNENDFEDDIEDDENPAEYPYYTLYWSNPGMGASIGLRCNEQRAATLGCYVQVHGDLFFLTVRHVIGDRSSHENIGDSVTSPAQLQLNDTMLTLEVFHREISTKMEDVMNRDFNGLVELTAADASSELRSLCDQMSQIKQHIKDCTGNVDDFTVGSIAYISELDVRRPRFSNASSLGHCMDWALCSVLPPRAGLNKLRYIYNETLGKDDFLAGDTKRYGAGEIHQETSAVKENSEAYFVGQTSGRQSGKINSAGTLVSRNNNQSIEWSLILNKQQKRWDYRGDSGATIMDKQGRIVGLLWGQLENLFLFTPINEVFQDIQEKVGTEDVCLPPPKARPESSSSLSISGRNEVTTLCRELPRRKVRRVNLQSIQKAPYSTTVYPEEVQEPTLRMEVLVGHAISWIPEETRVLEISSNASSRPSSPVPSLGYSTRSSTSSEEDCLSCISQQKMFCTISRPLKVVFDPHKRTKFWRDRKSNSRRLALRRLALWKQILGATAKRPGGFGGFGVKIFEIDNNMPLPC